jgi:hypothetical protein
VGSNLSSFPAKDLDRPHGGGLADVVAVALERLAQHGDGSARELQAVLGQPAGQSPDDVSRHRVVELPGEQHEVREGEFLHKEVPVLRQAGSARGPGPWDVGSRVALVHHPDDPVSVDTVVLG